MVRNILLMMATAVGILFFAELAVSDRWGYQVYPDFWRAFGINVKDMSCK